jgi:SAM-dependent methyltransferase
LKTLEEPLELSAPIAWRLAPATCRTDPATGENCSWNHGLWQYLRLMGLVTSPSYHADFYRAAFDAVEGVGRAPRVLVSGAADYGMLACVLAAFRGRGVEPAITVIDVCETPLALSRWYAEQASCEVETFCSDILEYRCASAFDAVCSDSFFGRFTPAGQGQVIEKWRNLLLPGGLAITVNRTRPGRPGERISFNAAQAEAFRVAVVRGVEVLPESVRSQVNALEIVGQAERYAARHFTYAAGSAQDLRGLFESRGFRVGALWAGTVAAGNRQKESGPSVRGDGDYAKIVARRL